MDLMMEGKLDGGACMWTTGVEWLIGDAANNQVTMSEMLQPVTGSKLVSQVAAMLKDSPNQLVKHFIINVNHNLKYWACIKNGLKDRAQAHKFSSISWATLSLHTLEDEQKLMLRTSHIIGNGAIFRTQMLNKVLHTICDGHYNQGDILMKYTKASVPPAGQSKAMILKCMGFTCLKTWCLDLMVTEVLALHFAAMFCMAFPEFYEEYWKAFEAGK
ncbi:uncharacterized protein BJ212DRAFT_1304623 [Suillus subaureus]|uniref:Uncharacterized protein n=1 Tax=Suillus subaureus TaxID=48587 RepID=A0A9P7J4V6_9AGAM|nr:uncharacterized protein BJ212DRAFT_1304623 [Suillus subaureus]KAG1803295.1 hypothetical protein BJ212DRAFT_1304623 [Suillus subaureus]